MASVTVYQENALEFSIEDEDPLAFLVACDRNNPWAGVRSRGMRGLGARNKLCAPPGTIAARSHNNQAYVLYMRQLAVYLLMQPGRTLTPVVERGSAYLRVDPPVRREETPDWGILPMASWSTATLITNTAKMAAPSFSLPAGSPSFLGACPGSKYGMTIEASDIVRSADNKRRLSVMVDGDTPQTIEDWYDTAICQHCYAVKGNYAYLNKQLQQMALLFWTRAALRDGSFVPVMTAAIEHSKFYSRQAEDRRWLEVINQKYGRNIGYQRYFRLHDSGDFFSFEYVKAWKEIADYFMPGKGPGTPTLFWAPTRLWAAGPTARSWFRVFEGAGDLSRCNMVIRPSAYHVNRRPPAPAPGESAGSTVHTGGPEEEAAAISGGVFNYPCPASAVGAETKTCVEVQGPDGGKGCRACWVRPQDVVSYHLH